jgi:NAD dependent epimerase/dehydratase
VRAMVLYNSFNSWGNLELLPPDVLSAIEIYSGDVRDPFSVAKGVAGCDYVFHLAALIAIPYSYQAPQSYVETNVSGTLNVLEACRTQGVKRMIHTSTSETYGTALYTPIDEKHPLQGQSPYSASKIGADKMAESYHLSFDLPVATIRPFNTYGPRQSARAVIPTIISQALAGAREIRLGALTPVRDFTFVADTVEGFLSMALSDGAVGKTINFGYGEGITVGQTAEKIIDVLGLKGKVTVANDPQRHRPENSEVFTLICSRDLAQKTCGWQPRVSLSEGIAKTVEFIKRHPEKFKTTIYNV